MKSVLIRSGFWFLISRILREYKDLLSKCPFSVSAGSPFSYSAVSSKTKDLYVESLVLFSSNMFRYVKLIKNLPKCFQICLRTYPIINKIIL